MPNKKQKLKIFQTPRGTHDILPQDQKYWDRIRTVSQTLASYYGFERIDTPHLESTDLFLHTVGPTSDIVEKQMYSFKTRGGDALTLRPEGTAPIARSYIENGFLNLPQPVKLYYRGSFFRHESPQRGRYREFHQWGLELLGEESAIADAEIFQVCSLFLSELGLKDILFYVNSVGCRECRPKYRSALSGYYRSRVRGLCKDCKRRYKDNPLRLLDCKEEKCVTVKKSAPQILDHLCEACKNHFTVLLEFLDEIGVAYMLNPYLVRGLDYYSRTVFEIASTYVAASEPEVAREALPSINAENRNAGDEKKEEDEEENVVTEVPIKEEKAGKEPLALGGGGRYDYLVELLGGRPTPGVGMALGMERLAYAMKQQQVKIPASSRQKLFFVHLGELAKKKSFKIIEMLRRANIAIAESLGKDSIKSQLKLADRAASEYALILGQKEAIDGTVIIREMSSGTQETVLQEKLIEILKQKLRR
ncbi:histidine--tRNA ligase [Patescibacteria group bacterium]|nr:histidine--tRNA ligase [Patescibacteria group bacterium]